MRRENMATKHRDWGLKISAVLGAYILSTPTFFWAEKTFTESYRCQIQGARGINYCSRADGEPIILLTIASAILGMFLGILALALLRLLLRLSSHSPSN